METLKMVWRTALFLGAVTVVFVLYTVGVALVERHFSPKYAKKQDQLTRDQGSPELQKQVPPVSVEHSAALIAGATGQTDK